MFKELKLLTNEIITNESADKEYKAFVKWLCEFISKNESDDSVSARVVIKKIEDSKAKTLEELKTINSQTINLMVESWRKTK